MNKTHRNCLRHHRKVLEEKYGYKCVNEHLQFRDSSWKRLDLVCHNPDSSLPSVAIEAESSKNFSNPQIVSNAEDGKAFVKAHHNSKFFHIHTSEIIDFDKELKPKPQIPQHRIKPFALKPLRRAFVR